MSGELLDTTWSGNFELSDIENDTGWTIIRHPDFGACLINLSLDEEGIESTLPLLDLFQNPVFPVALLNAQGKLDLKYFPSLVIGKTYIAATALDMLSLVDPETGLTPKPQSICITGDKQEAVSYILAGTDATNIKNWIELRAKNILWSDIKENPIQFPLSHEDWNSIFYHEHKGKYAELDKNGKLSSSVITKFTLGSRFHAFSQGLMLSLPAAPGDICTRLDFHPRKSYILYGDASNLDSWIYLEPPENGVESINGQTGNAFLIPEDIGASPENHTHEAPLIIKEANGKNLKFRYNVSTDVLSIYINNSLIATLNFADTGHLVLNPSDAGAAPADHLHDERYSKLDHLHDERYSNIDHLHDERYSNIDHLHDERYSKLDHLHDERYSKLDHLHDERYSNIDHLHDERYSKLDHLHDENYSKLEHLHDERYSKLEHLHDENYSKIEHSHDERYPTLLKSTTPQLIFDFNGTNLFYSIDGGISWLPFA